MVVMVIWWCLRERVSVEDVSEKMKKKLYIFLITVILEIRGIN